MRTIPRILLGPVLGAVLALVTGAAVLAGPASAITYGQPDGDGHPYVGLLVTRDANGFARCTGTLVSPTVLVTAGHCTAGITEDVQVWFRPGPIDGDPDFPADGPDPCAGIAGYPCTGEVSGTASTYPGYDPDAPQTADVGVVVLHEAVDFPEHAVLPAPNQLDGLKPSAKTTFTAVGYGQQRASKNGRKDVAIRERMVSHPKLAKINDRFTGDYSFLTSQNASTGGICLGDSGGPMLSGDNVLVGVISYVTNDTCKGQAGVFRLDRAGPLGWVSSFVD